VRLPRYAIGHGHADALRFQTARPIRPRAFRVDYRCAI